MAYIDRRTAEGLFDRDIVRWLKRHVANEMFVLLTHPAVALLSEPRLRQHRHPVGVVLPEAAKQLDVPYQRRRRLEIGQRADINLETAYGAWLDDKIPQPNQAQKRLLDINGSIHSAGRDPQYSRDARHGSRVDSLSPLMCTGFQCRFHCAAGGAMNDVGKDETTCCDVGVTELAATEWRVCNRLLKDGDSAAILGFIRQVADCFEATNLGQLTERSYFSSFEQAAVSLVSPMVWT